MTAQGQWRLRDGLYRQVALFPCMDDVVCTTAALFMRLHYNADYCDVKSLAGPNEYFTHAPGMGSKLHGVQFRARIAVVNHCAAVLGTLGHEGCLKHPGSRDEQVEDIKRSLQLIAEWSFIQDHGVTPMGLWMVRPADSPYGLVAEAFELHDGDFVEIPTARIEEVNKSVMAIMRAIDAQRQQLPPFELEVPPVSVSLTAAAG